MVNRKTKNLLLGVILFLALGVSIKVTIFYFAKHGAANEHVKVAPLPMDVEIVLKGYSYTETADDMIIKIAGEQLVRRGRKLLGLRSNVVKTNFFRQINGTIITRSCKVAFSASEAEWDANPAHPLILKGSVTIKKDEKDFVAVNTARIFFRQGVIEINADKVQTVKFR